MDVNNLGYPTASNVQRVFDVSPTLHEPAPRRHQSQFDAVSQNMNAYAQTYYLNQQNHLSIHLKDDDQQVVFHNVNYNPHPMQDGFVPGPLRLDTNLNQHHFQQQTPVPYIDGATSFEPIPQFSAGWGQAYLPSQDGLPAPSSSLASSIASSPIIKTELAGSSPLTSSGPSLNGSFSSCPDISSQCNDLTNGSSSPTMSDTKFSTDVDTLMRAIQTKAQQSQPPQDPGEDIKTVPSSSSSIRSGKRRYNCSVAECKKSFYQKTHLEIHMRAHTGVKPFVCKQPGCGQRFSQAGNLRTHERRHTGERPYKCDLCDKTFAQRGNVRAHRSVHSQVKPYTCMLDDCNKRFTQLGNLKSHQNKFHADTIRNLRLRFETLQPGETVGPWEENMWRYFCDLYKHCNKGIKGRGRNRRISEGSSEGDIKREDCDSVVSVSNSGTMAFPETHDHFSRRGSYTSLASDDSPAQQGFFDFHNPATRNAQQQMQHAQQQAMTFSALPVLGSASAMTGLCIGVPEIPDQLYTTECMGAFGGGDASFY